MAEDEFYTAEGTVQIPAPRRGPDLVITGLDYGTGVATFDAREPGRLSPVDRVTWPEIYGKSANRIRPCYLCSELDDVDPTATGVPVCGKCQRVHLT